MPNSGNYSSANRSRLDSSKESSVQVFDTIKNVIKAMEGLSEDGFNNRYMNDPHFKRGFDWLVHSKIY